MLTRLGGPAWPTNKGKEVLLYPPPTVRRLYPPPAPAHTDHFNVTLKIESLFIIILWQFNVLLTDYVM